MKEITFIIGLPGSGKSILLDYYKSHPFIDYKIYDDWMEWTLNSHPIKEFNSDIHFEELVEDLSNSKHVIVSCISFCKTDFLYKSEYHLKTQFPEIIINKIYFENNFEKCKQNIEFRDKKRGGYWEPNEKGEMWYYGEIYAGGPLYLHEIQNAEELSKNYYIPSNVYPLIIQTQ